MRKTRHERSWKSVQISARTKIASGRILWRGPLRGKNQKISRRNRPRAGNGADRIQSRRGHEIERSQPGQGKRIRRKNATFEQISQNQRDSSVATGPRHAHRKSQIQQHGTRKTSTSKWGTTSLTKQNANHFFH
jgi:hypothetical protein